jgi:hypothetical protein
MQIAQRIADQLETVPLIELVELLEEPEAVERRVRARMLAERFPHNLPTTKVEGETR